ncbi:MAG: hypothetical protein FJZ56_04500 [Chlamydiae bacterium]|nr:hypothetical protein [Chlamydiota bacterium]
MIFFMPSLDDMLYRASIAKRPPKMVAPPQWLPNFIRWPLKILFHPFVLLDQMAQKIAKMIIKPPFKQIGKCKKRGNCCHYILMKKSKGFLTHIDLFWQTQVNGFFLREKNSFLYQGKEVYVLGCRYLKEDGSCKHYRFRPSICRNWPKIEVFGAPQMLKGCGFLAQERATGNVWDYKFDIYSDS